MELSRAFADTVSLHAKQGELLTLGKTKKPAHERLGRAGELRSWHATSLAKPSRANHPRHPRRRDRRHGKQAACNRGPELHAILAAPHRRSSRRARWLACTSA